MPSVKPHTMNEYMLGTILFHFFCVKMRHFLLCNEKTSSLSTAINISINIHLFSQLA